MQCSDLRPYVQWTSTPSLVQTVLRFLNLQSHNAWGGTERSVYSDFLPGTEQSENFSTSPTPTSELTTDTAAPFAALSGDSEVFNLDALD